MAQCDWRSCLTCPCTSDEAEKIQTVGDLIRFVQERQRENDRPGRRVAVGRAGNPAGHRCHFQWWRRRPLSRPCHIPTGYNERMARKKKIRTDFRKEHQVRRRQKDLTRKFARDDRGRRQDSSRSERLTGKGDLTRKRTIVGVESDPESAGFGVLRDVASTVAPRPRAQRARPVERRPGRRRPRVPLRHPRPAQGPQHRPAARRRRRRHRLAPPRSDRRFAHRADRAAAAHPQPHEQRRGSRSSSPTSISS